MSKKKNADVPNDSQDEHDASRRNFITKSAAVGAGLVVGSVALATSSGYGESSKETGSRQSRLDSGQSRERYLGSLKVTGPGFGCMNVAWAYGPATERVEAVRLVRDAYENGYRFFDTAEVYGPFYSEEVVGEALQSMRDDVVIATKFGFEVDQMTGERKGLNSHPKYMKASVERMLKRLRTDRIDLLYQHRIDPDVPIEEVAGAVKDLINEGKVKHFGLSAAGGATIRRAHAELTVTAVQNEYSFWTRDPEHEVLPVCEELGIGLVPWSPLGMGYLTGKVTTTYRFPEGDLRASFPRFTKEAMLKNRQVLDILQKMAVKKGATSGQIDLAWLLAKKPFIVPIPGTINVNHMKENWNAAKISLTPTEMEELEFAFAAVEVFGRRAPEALMQAHDIGVNIGSSSQGTHGSTPLP